MRAEIQAKLDDWWGSKNVVPPPGYAEQIEEMAQRAKAWRLAHPNEEILIRWPDYRLVSSISDAVKQRLISTNPAALELIKSMWSWEAETEPSANMVMWALELSV